MEEMEVDQEEEGITEEVVVVVATEVVVAVVEEAEVEVMVVIVVKVTGVAENAMLIISPGVTFATSAQRLNEDSTDTSLMSKRKNGVQFQGLRKN